MGLNLKKKKTDACDAMRCKEVELTVVDDGVMGPLKLCARHLEAYEADGRSRPPPDGTAAAVAQPADNYGSNTDPQQAAVLATVEPERVNAVSQLAALAELTITNQAQHTATCEFLQQVKGRAKQIEEQRTSVTKPMNEAKRRVDEWFNPAKKALGALEAHVKKAIAAFVDGQEAERVAQLQAGNHEAGLAVEPAAMPSGTRTYTVWTFEVTDPNSIPREYLVPDAAKIQAHVSMHKNQSAIPGVRAIPQTKVASASKAAS